MSKIKFETSKAEGKHFDMSLWEGEWEGITKTWFDPNVLSDESPMSATMRPVLNGMFIVFEYSGMITGKPFSGMMTLGNYLLNNKFQSSWIDSFHMGTGIMFSESKADENKLSVFGSYDTGVENTPLWGWRTTIEMPETNKLIVTAYNITPEGEEAKATETIFTRKK